MIVKKGKKKKYVVCLVTVTDCSHCSEILESLDYWITIGSIKLFRRHWRYCWSVGGQSAWAYGHVWCGWWVECPWWLGMLGGRHCGRPLVGSPGWRRRMMTSSTLDRDLGRFLAAKWEDWEGWGVDLVFSYFSMFFCWFLLVFQSLERRPLFCMFGFLNILMNRGGAVTLQGWQHRANHRRK